MPKRKRIAILGSSLALATAGAAAFFLVTAPAASASTQVVSDLVNIPHGAGVSRSVALNSTTRGKVAQVGLLPYGADATHGCAFGLLSTWSTYGALTYQVENSSADQNTCSADVVVAYIDPFRTWSTGALASGQTRGWTWNNANPLSAIHLAGVEVPNVAGCSMTISRTFYRQQPGGEREFVLYVRNNGTVTCTGTVLLARVTATKSWTTSFGPGGTTGAWDIGYPGNQRPAPSAFHPAVFGVSPEGATDRPCIVQTTRLGFGQQRLDGSQWSGSVHTHTLTQNIGNISCGAKVLAAELS